MKLENRLTKIEETLSNINRVIVEGELVARVNAIEQRVATIEERGCTPGMECYRLLGGK